MRFFATVLSLLLAVSLQAEPLRCNYSSKDISTTDDEHVMLAGFAARSKLSDGIHLPLRTHCLVLADGAKKVCLISNDVMEISPALANEIRDRIAIATGLDRNNILMHNIHTHSAPRFGGIRTEFGGSNYMYKLRSVDAIVSNAVNTIMDDKSFGEFSIEIGRTTTDIAGNRCEKTGPLDSSVYAARFLDKKGKPVCALVNLACHPVCMGPWSLALSSDYSGVARKIISEKWGCEVFQLTGAAGNIDPARGPQRTSEYAEECGKSLAASLSGIEFTPVKNDGTLTIFNNVSHLPYAIPEVTKEAVIAHADSIAKAYKTDFPSFAEDVQGWKEQILSEWDNPGKNYRSLDFNMTALNVNGLIFFFTQGEPFCEYQMEARAAFPQQTVFFAGYTNGQNSYLPSKRAYQVRKGYEYEVEQMHVYIKSPYPLSEKMPDTFRESIFKTIAAVAGVPRYNIIPAPASLIPADGEFEFKSGMAVACDPDFAEVAADFAAQVKTAAGLALKMAKTAAKGITIVKKEGIAPEGYEMTIAPKNITIAASDRNGAFYALQSLCQLMPAAIYGRAVASGVKWTAPCCTISDAPRFSYRGMLLDCGRYFRTKEEVLGFIDMMAMHKMNYLQWHLTEDQGWRIEIKKYPKLTEVGAFRPETKGYGETGDGKPHGGFYTQDDVREIVEYARRRCVDIIPEIELPGHSGAAIAAYPWLSCTPDEPKAVVTSWGVKKDVYCPKPETFEFLENVFLELFDLFPCKYYHIGGDECPKDAWRASEYCHKLSEQLGLSGVDDLQYYFVKHFDKFLRDHGKTVIGWDEILDGSAVQSTIVMSYRGHKPASRAMAAGMKTILCPNRWCYYDYQQEEIEDIFKNHHLFITLRKGYNWDHKEQLNPDVVDKCDDLLLGVQANVWGEFIPDRGKLETQTYPREALIAETAWTAEPAKSFNSFRMRLFKEFERIEAKGYDYSKAFYQTIINMNLESDYPREVELELDYPYADIHYTLDGSEPTAESPVAPAFFTAKKGDVLRACGFRPDGSMVGTPIYRKFGEKGENR